MFMIYNTLSVLCDHDISAKSFTTPISNPKVPGSIPWFGTDYINLVYL